MVVELVVVVVELAGLIVVVVVLAGLIVVVVLPGLRVVVVLPALVVVVVVSVAVEQPVIKNIANKPIALNKHTFFILPPPLFAYEGMILSRYCLVNEQAPCGWKELSKNCGKLLIRYSRIVIVMTAQRLAWLIVVPVVVVLGCAANRLPMQPQVDRFQPIITEPAVSTFINNGETFISYEADDYPLSAALFEFQSILLLSLQIHNLTDTDLKPEEYSVSLHDGRDLKLITMLSRTDMMVVKDKLQGKSTGGGLENQVIQGALNAVSGVTSVISKSDVSHGLDLATNNYFSFRPIYKHATRDGILCFVLDFHPEYPITLMVKIRDQLTKLKFMPKPGQ